MSEETTTTFMLSIPSNFQKMGSLLCCFRLICVQIHFSPGCMHFFVLFSGCYFLFISSTAVMLLEDLDRPKFEFCFRTSLYEIIQARSYLLFFKDKESQNWCIALSLPWRMGHRRRWRSGHKVEGIMDHHNHKAMLLRYL